MPEPDQFKCEVAVKFGQERIVLRCSYDAINKMLPHLEDAPLEVAQRRHKCAKRQQDAYRRPTLPLERWEWNHHLLGALAAYETRTVARCVAILAEEHHPGVTFERVMEVSPSWGLLHGPIHDMIVLFHFKPGEEPDLKGLEKDGPFGVLGRLSETLSRLLSRTVSPQPSSGG